MKNISELNFKKYELIAFDWDGTLVDSLDFYTIWDQLFLKKFYGVELPLSYFGELSLRIKNAAVGNSRDDYFRYLDVEHGSGSLPINSIWDNVYKLAPDIQSQIGYKMDAHKVLRKLRQIPDMKLALVTNSELRDLVFYTSEKSKTAGIIKPLHFFDLVVTSDDVDRRKPHPESYLKVIDYFKIRPSHVLVFEDSLSGIRSAKEAGADVVCVYDKWSERDRFEINKLSDYAVRSWSEVLEL